MTEVYRNHQFVTYFRIVPETRGQDICDALLLFIYLSKSFIHDLMGFFLALSNNSESLKIIPLLHITFRSSKYVK